MGLFKRDQSSCRCTEGLVMCNNRPAKFRKTVVVTTNGTSFSIRGHSFINEDNSLEFEPLLGCQQVVSSLPILAVPK